MLCGDFNTCTAHTVQNYSEKFRVYLYNDVRFRMKIRWWRPGVALNPLDYFSYSTSSAAFYSSTRNRTLLSVFLGLRASSA